jgi:hypothetical protein
MFDELVSGCTDVVLTKPPFGFGLAHFEIRRRVVSMKCLISTKLLLSIGTVKVRAEDVRLGCMLCAQIARTA